MAATIITPANVVRAMHVLIIDDDRALRDALRRTLTLVGYEVTVAEDAERGLDVIATERPDAVLLDVGLPGVDGLEACRRLRAGRDRTPVLILTARDAIEHRIDGLDAGADDYLVKPFDTGELKARLRALLRRAQADEAGEPEPEFAGLRLDRARHGATAGGSFAELSRTEYQLLDLFLHHPGQVLTHDVIYDRVWGYDFGPASNSLRVYVGYLRRKLAQIEAGAVIATVHGVGYVLREP
jgi:two-component system response regulator MprA